MYNSRKDIRLFVLVLLLCHIITCHCKPLKVGYQIEEVSLLSIIFLNKYIGTYVVLYRGFAQMSTCLFSWKFWPKKCILIIQTQQKIIPTYLPTTTYFFQKTKNGAKRFCKVYFWSFSPLVHNSFMRPIKICTTNKQLKPKPVRPTKIPYLTSRRYVSNS